MRALLVDDDELNLKILRRDLQREGHNVACAENGVQALELLEKDKRFDVILLDRMMPEMDGMQVLEQLRADSVLSHIPVVMQTAAAASDQVREGIEAGVFYYLTKPFEKGLMLAVVSRAVQHAEQLRKVDRKADEYRDHAKQLRDGISLFEHCALSFRTLSEARKAAFAVAQCFPDPSRVAYGIHELMLNAVEHGNLEIKYQEKTKLILSGKWQEEIERRLGHADYETRIAAAEYYRRGSTHELVIRDEGNGFDFESFLELSPNRAADPNGRGIFSARTISFDELEYQGCGNQVVCRVNLTS